MITGKSTQSKVKKLPTDTVSTIASADEEVALTLGTKPNLDTANRINKYPHSTAALPRAPPPINIEMKQQISDTNELPRRVPNANINERDGDTGTGSGSILTFDPEQDPEVMNPNDSCELTPLESPPMPVPMPMSQDGDDMKETMEVEAEVLSIYDSMNLAKNKSGSKNNNLDIGNDESVSGTPNKRALSNIHYMFEGHDSSALHVSIDDDIKEDDALPMTSQTSTPHMSNTNHINLALPMTPTQSTENHKISVI